MGVSWSSNLNGAYKIIGERSPIDVFGISGFVKGYTWEVYSEVFSSAVPAVYLTIKYFGVFSSIIRCSCLWKLTIKEIVNSFPPKTNNAIMDPKQAFSYKWIPSALFQFWMETFLGVLFQINIASWRVNGGDTAIGSEKFYFSLRRYELLETKGFSNANRIRRSSCLK